MTILIDIHQRVPHGMSQLQREITFFNTYTHTHTRARTKTQGHANTLVDTKNHIRKHNVHINTRRQP